MVSLSADCSWQTHLAVCWGGGGGRTKRMLNVSLGVLPPYTPLVESLGQMRLGQKRPHGWSDTHLTTPLVCWDTPRRMCVEKAPTFSPHPESASLPAVRKKGRATRNHPGFPRVCYHHLKTSHWGRLCWVGKAFWELEPMFTSDIYLKIKTTSWSISGFMGPWTHWHFFSDISWD
jgi:hypothetical protein